MAGRKSQLALFDLDGTLTLPRLEISDAMLATLRALKKHADIGLVSGSDLAKLTGQFGGENNIREICDYVFSENGLVAYKGDKLLGSKKIVDYLGEDALQKVVNFVLAYFSQLTLPFKRGTFVEYRTGMLNFSPVGRNCTDKERLQFLEYDRVFGVRSALKAALEKEFASYGLQFSIGGQISLDCFPIGWDKRFCLRYLRDANYDEIHFYGDRTKIGGNDFEIFMDERTVGHTVEDPTDTTKQLTELFMIISQVGE